MSKAPNPLRIFFRPVLRDGDTAATRGVEGLRGVDSTIPPYDKCFYDESVTREMGGWGVRVYSLIIINIFYI